MARKKNSKLERCLKKVKKKGTARNPWAVCQAALKGKKRGKKKK